MSKVPKDIVALSVLKIMGMDGKWQWITDVRGIQDKGGTGNTKSLLVSRLDGEHQYTFEAKKIYLCSGVTGSTIDCLL